MTAEGTFPKVNGDILYASEANSFNDSGWHKIISNVSIDTGLIRFSSVIWNTINDRTTDGGATWTGVDGYSVAGEDIADASGAIGVAADADDASTSFTIDSGANWAASSTLPSAGNMTKINCISVFGATAVVGGDSGADESIYYSTDNGDNFAEADSGPTSEVVGIVMASATVGYAVVGSNIWKTTNSGQDWTDTTDDFALTPSVLFAIDTDTILALGSSVVTLEKYINSTNTITTILSLSMGLANNANSNIVKATNGNYYWAHEFGVTAGADESGGITLFKYDGTSIYMKALGESENSSMASKWRFNTTGLANVLIEGASNVLYLNIGRDHILEIRVEGD